MIDRKGYRLCSSAVRRAYYTERLMASSKHAMHDPGADDDQDTRCQRLGQMHLITGPQEHTLTMDRARLFL
jgi:hypothetical protein